MNDVQEAAQEAAPDVVQTEAEQVEAPEAAESTEGQVESQPAEGESETPEGDEPKPEEISPSKARRDRRKAEMDRVHRENAELSEKLAETETQLRNMEEAVESAPPPKESDFGSYDEYQAQLSAYYSVNALDKRQLKEVAEKANSQKAQINQKEQARQSELKANWQDQLSEASQTYADFEQVFHNDVPVTPEMAEIIAGSDVGVDVAYWLGTNLKEASSIAQSSPLEQARRIGAIEARLELPKANMNSSAPAPIRPVRGKGTVQKTIENMTMDEYAEARKSGKLK